MKARFFLLVLLFLSACNGGDDGGNPPHTPTTAATSTSTSVHEHADRAFRADGHENATSTLAPRRRRPRRNVEPTPTPTFGEACLTGDSAAEDRNELNAARLTVEADCPCEESDAHVAYLVCVGASVSTVVDGGQLRRECVEKLAEIENESTCGQADAVPCVSGRQDDLTFRACSIVPEAECVNDGNFLRTACRAATHCIDAADTNGDLAIALPDELHCVSRQTVDLPSQAAPPHTPGSPGVSRSPTKSSSPSSAATASASTMLVTRAFALSVRAKRRMPS